MPVALATSLRQSAQPGFGTSVRVTSEHVAPWREAVRGSTRGRAGRRGVLELSRVSRSRHLGLAPRVQANARGDP
jgi:hypothetical protein